VAQIATAADAELVVNATPVGMAVTALTPAGTGRVARRASHESGDTLPLGLEPSSLGAGQLVVDLVYVPPVTPLTEQARERGARTASGLGMLIHQAARQFRLWTGEDPPLEVMSGAAVAALGRLSDVSRPETV
jgi:shikimate dehydrogenase